MPSVNLSNVDIGSLILPGAAVVIVILLFSRGIRGFDLRNVLGNGGDRDSDVASSPIIWIVVIVLVLFMLTEGDTNNTSLGPCPDDPHKVCTTRR